MPDRILICGGRYYDDWGQFNRIMYELDPPSQKALLGKGKMVLIFGDCPTGADAFADQWSVVNWKAFECYEADWGKYGRAAGPIRNQGMLDKGKPDLVVAFPGGRGTADMVKRARRAGIQVREISPNE